MTGPDVVANLQEEPQGEPWEREWVRDWKPRPFDLGEYERWAKQKASVIVRVKIYGKQGRGRTFYSGAVHQIDPLLQP